MSLSIEYFRNLLNTETNQLNKLCQKWNQIMKNESNISENGLGQILSTIGQTNLLINQRFKQFNGLIDDCELKRSVKEIKVEDLQGFWDMIYFQVIEMHNKFNYLNEFKSNYWVENEIKVVKKINKKKKSKAINSNEKYSKQIPVKPSVVVKEEYPKQISVKPSVVVKEEYPKQISVKPSIKSSVREHVKCFKSQKVNENVDKREVFCEIENLCVKSCVESIESENSSQCLTPNKIFNKTHNEYNKIKSALDLKPLFNAIDK